MSSKDKTIEDEIEVATREAHIAELEATIRRQHEERAALEEKIAPLEAAMKEERDKKAQDFNAHVVPLRERIGVLEKENNALRKHAAESLAAARAHRDRYDALCNELGALGVDLPKLRKGEIKVA